MSCSFTNSPRLELSNGGLILEPNSTRLRSFLLHRLEKQTPSLLLQDGFTAERSCNMENLF
jgi:hypothetical protein